MRFALTWILLTALTTSAMADQYRCVPDRATGFKYSAQNKTWEPTQFRTDDRYIIAPAKNGRDAYFWTKVGETEPAGICSEEFNSLGFLFCNTIGGEIKFNRVNGRYILVYLYAYYTVGAPGSERETDENSGSPMIQIGKCSPF